MNEMNENDTTLPQVQKQQPQDPMHAITDEGTRHMVGELRRIRGYGPNTGSGLTERELLEAAFEAMAERE